MNEMKPSHLRAWLKEKKKFLATSLVSLVIFGLFQNCGSQHNYVAEQFVALGTDSSGLTVTGIDLSSVPPPRSASAEVEIGGKMYIFGGYYSATGPGTALNDFYSFDPVAQEWTNLSVPSAGTPPSIRYLARAANVGGILYLFGGRDMANMSLDDFYSYDPSSKTWTNLSVPASGALPQGRYGHSMVVIDNKIYMFGGAHVVPSASFAFLNDLYSYDPVSNVWTDLSVPISGSAPSPRSSHVAGVISGVMHIFGGNSNGTGMNDMNVYDPVARSWAVVNVIDANAAHGHAAPSARVGASAVVIDNKMYVFGGQGYPSGLSMNDLYVYEHSAGGWSNLSIPTTGTVPQVRQNQSAVAISGKMYIFDGDSFISWSPAVSARPSDLNYYEPMATSWVNLY